MDIVGWIDSLAATIPPQLAWVLGALFALLESGLGLGFVVPGETVVLLLAATLPTWPAAIGMFLAVAIGASAGDHIGYAMGRRLGGALRQTRLVRRVGVGNWDRAVAVMERRGAITVFATRLLPVVRTLAPAAAGVARISYRSFLVASLAGGALWSAVYVGAGFLLRGSLDAVQNLLGEAGLAVVLGLAAATGMTLALRAILNRQRADAAGLGHERLAAPDSHPREAAAAHERSHTDQPSAYRHGARAHALFARITQGEPWRTIPNYISFARLALLPVLVALLAGRHFTASLVLATLLFASDWLDGYLARRTSAVSPLGAWLDPVADRIACVAVGVGCALGTAVPWEYVGLLVLPDIALGITAAVLFRGAPDITVTIAGKIRTALIFAGFALLLFGMALAEHGVEQSGVFVGWGFLVALAGLIGHYVAAVVYTRDLTRAWLGRRAQAPTYSARC